MQEAPIRAAVQVGIMEGFATDLALRASLLAMLLFGFSPRLLVRILIRAWPADDPRRRELMAELGNVPYLERLWWVGEQVETALFDGLPARWRKRRDARSERYRFSHGRKAGRGWLFQALVVATLGTVGVAWLSFDRTVTLTVDGQTRKVRTFARTVEGVLDQTDTTIQDASSISPPLSTPLRDGLRITVRSDPSTVPAERPAPSTFALSIAGIAVVLGGARLLRRGRGLARGKG
jgi:hypothetical protein